VGAAEVHAAMRSSRKKGKTSFFYFYFGKVRMKLTRSQRWVSVSRVPKAGICEPGEPLLIHS